MLPADTVFLRRCFDLARLGAGHVSPNPLVGAVLMHEGRIIGEGWHQRYGEAHAEVQAIGSVAAADRHLLPESTLYCSLEPCFHYGKTPPCVDLVLAKRIRRVVFSNVDPNPLVAGQSLQKLRAAGVEVQENVLADEGAWLNRYFFHWIQQQRPYVVLKWAQSADGLLGRPNARTAISGPLAQRLVHRWRSEVDAILVGAATARVDDPRLDNRLFWGPSPLRVALDWSGKIPADAHLLDDSQPTWLLGPAHAGVFRQTEFPDIRPANWIPELLSSLRAAKRAVLLVEGGAATLRQFLEQGYWDEIRLLEAPLRLGEGIAAPFVPAGARLRDAFPLGPDRVQIFTRMV